jgi:hypothetical protein
MKKFIITLIGLGAALMLCAQSPAAFKYQAVARNAAGAVLPNKGVSFRISILEGNETGMAVMRETHAATTNEFGLVSLDIGKGTFISGGISGIDWGKASHFLKIEMDPTGGTNYTLMGTTQLLSVPYALHAKSVENDQVVLTDATLTGDGTIANPLKIADNGVNSAKILDAAVSTSDLADNAVTTVKINNSAVNSDKLANSAVIAQKMASMGAVTGQVLKYDGNVWAPGNDLTGSSYWQQSGTNLFYNGGNVGIGMNNPQTDGLHINSNIHYSGILLTNDAAGTSPEDGLIIAHKYQANAPGNRFSFIVNHEQTPLYISTSNNWTGGLCINPSLNIGIGTWEPGAKLEVAGQVKITGGSPGAGKVLTSDASGLASWQTPASSSGPWQTFGNNIYFNGGNVGIGLSNPLDKIGIKGGSYSYVRIMNITSGESGNDGLVLGTVAEGNNAFLWNYENGPLVFGTNDSNRMIITSDGNIGIGNPDPGYKLDVSGNRINLKDGTEWIAMRTDGSPGFLDLSFGGGKLVIQGSTTNEHVILNPSMNKVGIRTWTPQYDLDVNGDIRARGSVFYGGSTGAADGIQYIKPDFVFEEEYGLMSTDKVEEFLTREKHLPWVTSAAREKKENNGAVNMTRMSFETLESVENVQLQVIRQEKKIRELEAENDELKARLDKIERMLKNR